MVFIGSFIAVSSVVTILIDAIGFYPSPGSPNFNKLAIV